MKPAFCFKVNLMRFLGRFKRPEIRWFSVYAYIRLPISPVFTDAKQTRSRVAHRASSVLCVCFRRGRAQVCNSVVVPQTVYVVDKLRRLCSVVVHPCQTMCPMASTKRKHRQVPTVMLTARNIANTHALGHFFTPFKQPRLRLVIKNFSDVLRCYSHGFLPQHTFNIEVV